MQIDINTVIVVGSSIVTISVLLKANDITMKSLVNRLDITDEKLDKLEPRMNTMERETGVLRHDLEACKERCTLKMDAIKKYIQHEKV